MLNVVPFQEKDLKLIFFAVQFLAETKNTKE